MRKFLLFLLVFSFTVPRPVWSVMHIKPGSYPNARKDDVHRVTNTQLRAAGSYHAAIIGSASGAKNVAVIIVQFPSASASLTSCNNTPPCDGKQNQIRSLANINQYFSKMGAYYQEVSYNKIPSITFKFFGPNGTPLLNPKGETTATAAGAITMANSMEYYGCGDEGLGCSGVNTPTFPIVNANGNYLIRDALSAARALHVNYAANLNTTNFDAVVVMHAGNGNETTLSNGDIWSIFYADDAGSPVIQSGGGGFTEGDVVPETEAGGNGCPPLSPLGVMCHEFGHELGLPDLYNTTVSGGTSVVGNWELMDSGPFDGCGGNPSHPGAWDRKFLNWITPTTVTLKATSQLGYVEASPGSMLKIPVQNGLPNEYFLIEYRSRSSGAQFDQNIPGDGLLIWHIDDDIALTRGIGSSDPSLQNTVNSGHPHYGVSIVTKNGLAISPSVPDGANAFGNADNFTSPKSDNFNGQPSGIIVLDISGVGSGTASMIVENFQVGTSQSILKVINYPNPAGKGYSHPNGEGHTTIQVQLSRPPNDLSMNIYTLSGDLVRKVGKTDIVHNSRSDDDNFKFVYEYMWDLKNGDGAMVAPGVYLYLMRADGESKSGKAVIIR